jgi:predicted porin
MRGQLDAVSFVADYRFAKRFDAYAGIMWSQVSNGLANGSFRDPASTRLSVYDSSSEADPVQ